MHRGFIKLWRKSFDAGWLKNHKLWAFWCWCIMKATHKELDQVIGFQTIHLMPGDFVFGRRMAASELNMSEREIRTAVDSLKTSRNIAIKTTNKFSIISVLNWDTYQQTENINDQQNDQLLTNKRPTTDHKQECKEYKNIKNKERVAFITPSLDDVSVYCRERENNIEPQTFVDFYTAKNWMIGKNKMRDWKAAIRTWESRNGNGIIKKEEWEV